MTDVAADTDLSANFVVRLWRGDVSLAKTYWLFGVLAGVVLRISSPLVTYFVVAHSSSMSQFDISAILDSWVLLVVFYSVFILIAIWRSANKYKKRFPEKAGRAGLAQIACIIGLLAILGSIAEVLLPDSVQFEHMTKGGGSADERLQYDAVISGLNANLPRQIDKVTTLTKIGVDKAGFQYYETITAALDNNDAFIGRMRPLMANYLCKDATAKDNMLHNLNYQYIYTDKNNAPIGILLITRSDCP